jgi:hypothetical protein
LPGDLIPICYFTQEPEGYSSDTAGFMGATLLLAGIITAIITAPLFDRVFTYHLAITAKILVPIIGVAWLGMIWAGKICAMAWGGNAYGGFGNDSETT